MTRIFTSMPETYFSLLAPTKILSKLILMPMTLTKIPKYLTLEPRPILS